MHLEAQLVQCFTDTVARFTQSRKLVPLTNRMVDDTLIYFKNYSVKDKKMKRRRTIVHVEEDTTFHHAMKFAGGENRVAVLNFANPYNPGGGVEDGAMAQEECLCRSSNLYAALTCRYVLTNYYRRNKRHRSPYGTDSIVYSRGVTVFKSDEEVPQLLENPFEVDVITCAAPYYDYSLGPYSADLYRDIFYSRIKNILEVAIKNDVDILVLGAFGCGAFNNPPDVVAEVFERLLIKEEYCHCFKLVSFAIKAGDNRNFETFKSVLDTGHDIAQMFQ